MKNPLFAPLKKKQKTNKATLPRKPKAIYLYQPPFSISITLPSTSCCSCSCGGSRAAPHQHGWEQIRLYRAVVPGFQYARGCSMTAICTGSQVFCIMESSACVVFNASSSHKGLKINYFTAVNFNALLLVFILLIY